MSITIGKIHYRSLTLDVNYVCVPDFFVGSKRLWFINQKTKFPNMIYFQLLVLFSNENKSKSEDNCIARELK